jgi:hypothetical protein
VAVLQPERLLHHRVRVLPVLTIVSGTAMSEILWGCRCAIGLVFVASIVGKVRGRESLADFVRAAGRLGSGWLTSRIPARVLAGGVIAAEAAVVVLLVRPGSTWAGFALAGLLAVAFAAAVVVALRRGDRSPCNCFGASARPIGRVHLVRNAVLVAVAGLGLAAEGAAVGPAEPAGVVAAVVAGVVVAAVVVRADDLADLFQPAAAGGDRARKGSSR